MLISSHILSASGPFFQFQEKQHTLDAARILSTELAAYRQTATELALSDEGSWVNRVHKAAESDTTSVELETSGEAQLFRVATD